MLVQSAVELDVWFCPGGGKVRGIDAIGADTYGWEMVSCKFIFVYCLV